MRKASGSRFTVGAVGRRKTLGLLSMEGVFGRESQFLLTGEVGGSGLGQAGCGRSYGVLREREATGRQRLGWDDVASGRTMPTTTYLGPPKRAA